jgi:lipopolysaccharide transport system ATP-binding protein
VDEVLAVGDAEFQKKAIGKMQDVSKGEGRTVLFVSHNMAAVKSLCQKGIVLENGKLAFQGNVDDSLRYYLQSGGQINGDKIINTVKHHKNTLHFDKITINGSENRQSVIPSSQHTLSLCIEGYSDEELKTDVMFIIKNKSETPLASLAEGYYRGKLDSIPKGHFCINKTIRLPKFLSNGRLYCDLMMHHPRVEWHLQAPNCCCLDCEGYQEEFGYTINQETYGLMGMEVI